MSLECSDCERDSRAGHAPDCKYVTVDQLRADLAAVTRERDEALAENLRLDAFVETARREVAEALAGNQQAEAL